MPRYYQVNQAYKNHHEFGKGYLCAPNLDLKHWQILKTLEVGDIIFHYSSHDKRIFGLSEVVELGPHKGLENALLEEGNSVYRTYRGEHLSLRHMSPSAAKAEKKHGDFYIEVHVSALFKRSYGENMCEGKQVYCVEVDPALAEKRLGL